MNEHNYLAKNLKNYKELKNLSIGKLAEELDISKATLKHIMNDGNTTLHTAIRISKNIGIGLDMLVSDNAFSDKLFIMDHMQRASSWFAQLNSAKKEQMAELISKMLTLLEDSKEEC